MKKRLLFLIIIGILLVVGYIAKAEVIEIKNPLKYDTIEKMIDGIASLLLVIVIPLATIMIIWAGIQYLTAANNEEQVKKAKNTIKWAIIGLAIVLAAKFITGLLEEILKKVE